MNKKHISRKKKKEIQICQVQENPCDPLQPIFSLAQLWETDDNLLKFALKAFAGNCKLKIIKNPAPFTLFFNHTGHVKTGICSIRIRYYVHSASHTMILLFATSKKANSIFQMQLEPFRRKLKLCLDNMK